MDITGGCKIGKFSVYPYLVIQIIMSARTLMYLFTTQMSAWLRWSTDPINGNNKCDQYWGDVTNVYNSTTPRNRTRQVKHAKDHWHSLNKLVFQFHCSWTKAPAIYASGQSGAQLLEKAHAFSESV